MMMDYKLCSFKFDLEGFTDPLIKQVSMFSQIEMWRVYHCVCDGLLLCVVRGNKGLVVWNPYLGQTRWIQPRESFHASDVYALGYDDNRNHKILRIFDESGNVLGYEIYDFSSDSWNVVYVTPFWVIKSHQRGVTLKGNAYFLARDVVETNDIILSFDFTTETFGPPLSLPYDHFNVSLSCVGDEQLAFLYHGFEFDGVVEIWVSDKIDPSFASWTMFLRQRDFNINICYRGASFFIDEETKVVVVFDLDQPKWNWTCRYHAAYIIGQDGYFKALDIREAPNLGEPDETGYTWPHHCIPLVCPSYLPSLVQLQIDLPGKAKESDY